MEEIRQKGVEAKEELEELNRRREERRRAREDEDRRREEEEDLREMKEEVKTNADLSNDLAYVSHDFTQPFLQLYIYLTTQVGPWLCAWFTPPGREAENAGGDCTEEDGGHGEEDEASEHLKC